MCDNVYSIRDPTPSTMTALHLFGAEMLKLSRGLDSFPVTEVSSSRQDHDETNIKIAPTADESEANCEAHKTDVLEINIGDSDEVNQHPKESISKK